MKEQKKHPSARFSRMIKLSKLSGGIGASYLGFRAYSPLLSTQKRKDKLLNKHQKNALRMAKTLSQLKGPAMKIGQILSTHEGALPQEFTEILSSLQSNAPPMAYELVSREVEKELGKKPEKIFKDFSSSACAAASLGQVHSAKLDDGTSVAVKVQYPGMEKVVESDLKNLRFSISVLRGAAAGVTGERNLDFTPVYEEIKEHMLMELDYINEAQNIERFSSIFGDNTDIKVPKAYPALSSRKVLTMDFIEGVNIKKAIAQGLQHPVREKIARILLHLFYYSYLVCGVLHADPHPGNYLITPQGSLGLVDYGCVKYFSRQFIQKLSEMHRAFLSNDRALLKESYTALELIKDSKDVEDIRKISDFYIKPVMTQGEFDYGQFDYVEEGKKLFEYFLSRRKIPPPQRDFLFLCRTALGMYEYLSRLEVKINVREIFLPLLEMSAKKIKDV